MFTVLFVSFSCLAYSNNDNDGGGDTDDGGKREYCVCMQYVRSASLDRSGSGARDGPRCTSARRDGCFSRVSAHVFGSFDPGAGASHSGRGEKVKGEEDVDKTCGTVGFFTRSIFCFFVKFFFFFSGFLLVVFFVCFFSSGSFSVIFLFFLPLKECSGDPSGDIPRGTGAEPVL